MKAERERLNIAPWRKVCEHGSQRAECPICELAEAEAEIARLRAALRRVEGLLDSTDAALSIAIREAKEVLGDD